MPCQPLHHRISLAVQACNSEDDTRCRQIADQLGLPLWTPGQHPQCILRVDGDRLEILKPDDPQLRGAVRAEFVTGKARYRRRQGGKQFLIRAVVGKETGKPTVADATAGLGRDSFLLASAGCTVYLFERHPIIAALLDNGLQRGLHAAETAAICSRMHLVREDFSSFWQGRKDDMNKPDVVYLDPMFPRRQKSAKVKKELQMLQLLVDREDQGEERLLQTALQVAQKRVVVKRPCTAPPLTLQQPTFSLSGKTTRFDVYIR